MPVTDKQKKHRYDTRTCEPELTEPHSQIMRILPCQGEEKKEYKRRKKKKKKENSPLKSLVVIFTERTMFKLKKVNK